LFSPKATPLVEGLPRDIKVNVPSAGGEHRNSFALKRIEEMNRRKIRRRSKTPEADDERLTRSNTEAS